MSRTILSIILCFTITFPAITLAEDSPPETRVVINLVIDKEPVLSDRYLVHVGEQTGSSPVALHPNDMKIDETGNASMVISPADDADKTYYFSVKAMSEQPLLCEAIDCERVDVASVIWMLQRLAGVR